ncbi:MAG: prenyltransferase [Dysgonamonadaceae bacterium]|jgi:1,4-dihydroxy-2-naphthoate octaprenyltransferase|nr:prenyltransferase [Dysgonamonadaceae bacterium]
MNIIRFWFNNARPTALPQSLFPAILAVCMASVSGNFSLYLGILAVLGVLFGHLSMNLFDDYFDYKVKGTDFRDKMAREGFRARIAKCEYLTSRKATLKQLLIACFVFSAISLLFASIIFIERGVVILYYVLALTVLGISYSGKPLKLSYRGLGELMIGIIFGPLSMTGVYYSACGMFNWAVVFISIPVGLLVANIVYVHAIMDYEPDKKVGKMTFAVLLGSKKRMLGTLLAILVISYLSIFTGIFLKYLSLYYFLTLFTLPMAISLYYLMREFVRHPQRKFDPKFWMGPMSNWEKIKEIEIDWFMIRWFSARNFLSFFCLIIIIATYLSHFFG